MILKNEIQGNKVQETAALVQSLQVNWFDYVKRVMGNVMGNDVSGLQLQLLFSKITYGFVLDLFCFLYFFCDSIFRADSVTGIVMQGYCVNSPLKTNCIDFCPL